MINDLISSFREICHRHMYTNVCMCMYICKLFTYICTYLCMGMLLSTMIIHLLINKVQYKPIICYKDKSKQWTESRLLKSYHTENIRCCQLVKLLHTTPFKSSPCHKHSCYKHYYTAYAHT